MFTSGALFSSCRVRLFEIEEICDPMDWAHLLPTFYSPTYPLTHVTSASVSYSLPTPWRYNCTPRPYQNKYPSLYAARCGFWNNVMSPPERTWLHKFLVNAHFNFAVGKSDLLSPFSQTTVFRNQQLTLFSFLSFNSYHQVGIWPSLWLLFTSKETMVIYWN